LTRHFVRVHGCHSVQWQYRCRKCNTEFLPADHRYPLRVVNTHVRNCVSRREITRKLGEREDLHGVRCDLCDYVGVSKRAVGMHRHRHANENTMLITGAAAQIEALSKQVGDIRVAGDYGTAAVFVEARIRTWAHLEKEILAYRLQGYSVTYGAIVVGSLETCDPKNDAILKRISVVSERIYRRHLGLPDLLPKTGTNRRPVGTTVTDPPMISVRRSAIPSALRRQVGSAWNDATRLPSECLCSVVSCSANRAMALQDPPSLEQRQSRPVSSLHQRGKTSNRKRRQRNHDS
ncbi:hypothetical protein T10_7437, partial [Trichinella papuae]